METIPMPENSEPLVGKAVPPNTNEEKGVYHEAQMAQTIEEEFMANGCILFKPYHLLKYISARSPISVADIGRNWKPGRDVSAEFKELYPKKGGKVSLIKILCNALVKYDLLNEHVSPKVTAQTNRGRMSSSCYGITKLGQDYLCKAFEEKKIDKIDTSIKSPTTEFVKQGKKRTRKSSSSIRRKRVSDEDELDYEDGDYTDDDDDTYFKEEPQSNRGVYFKEETQVKKYRTMESQNSSHSNESSSNTGYNQSFFGSTNTFGFSSQPPPMPLFHGAQRESELKGRNYYSNETEIKKSHDDQRSAPERYIVHLEEMLEQQNKVLLQKDHLINIKDKTIEQLQRHIEALTNNWTQATKLGYHNVLSLQPKMEVPMHLHNIHKQQYPQVSSQHSGQLPSQITPTTSQISSQVTMSTRMSPSQPQTTPTVTLQNTSGQSIQEQAAIHLSQQQPLPAQSHTEQFMLPLDFAFISNNIHTSTQPIFSQQPPEPLAQNMPEVEHSEQTDELQVSIVPQPFSQPSWQAEVGCREQSAQKD